MVNVTSLNFQLTWDISSVLAVVWVFALYLAVKLYRRSRRRSNRRESAEAYSATPSKYKGHQMPEGDSARCPSWPMLVLKLMVLGCSLLLLTSAMDYWANQLLPHRLYEHFLDNPEDAEALYDSFFAAQGTEPLDLRGIDQALEELTKTSAGDVYVNIASSESTDFLSNWLCGMRKVGLDKNTLVIGTDLSVCDTDRVWLLSGKCVALHVPPSPGIPTDLNKAAKLNMLAYGSEGYWRLMTIRTYIMVHVLRAAPSGTNLVFSDNDVVFASKPSWNGKYALEISSNQRTNCSANDRSDSCKPTGCGGLLKLRAFHTSVEAAMLVFAMQHATAHATPILGGFATVEYYNDQKAWNLLILKKGYDLRYKVLGVESGFYNGHTYFFEKRHLESELAGRVVALHANWIEGSDKKKSLLRKSNMWYVDVPFSLPAVSSNNPDLLLSICTA
jgi:hypothetical protein